MKRPAVILAGVLIAVGLTAYVMWLRPLLVGGRQLRNYADLQFYVAVLDQYHEANHKYPMTMSDALNWWVAARRPLRSYEQGEDSWGNQVYFVSDGQHFTLASFGRDNQPDHALPWTAGGSPRFDKAPCNDANLDTVVFDGGVDQACAK